MRKISLVYQYSGGCTPFKTCGECSNFEEHRVGNKKVFKCAVYGVSSSEATDWRKGWTACKMFNCKPPERPLFETGITRRKAIAPEVQVIGQMSIFDYLKL